MLHTKIESLIKDVILIIDDKFEILDSKVLQSKVIDKLIYLAIFGDKNTKASARYIIWETALALNIIPSSINNLYMARGRKEIPLNFTVPAINLRLMTYDMAQEIFEIANERNIGTFVFELARSEMGYTNQKPMDYTIAIMAAAIKANWSGPLFIQGDHFQAKAKAMGIPMENEIGSIKTLAKEAIDSGFYNIDIDMSTLVDLDKPNVKDQQIPNIKYTLDLASFIRKHEPEEITISLGGEIGHIGGTNSTVEGLDEYVMGFNYSFHGIGLSKIRLQTGTHHGGVVLPNGTLKKLSVDLNILSELSTIAREKYGMGGAVQHGASTLEDKYFSEFPKTTAIEIHFATGLQNLILDHPKFPKTLLSKMYTWIDTEKQTEKEIGWTSEQFHYKLRKKAIGQFEKEIWEIDPIAKKEIMKTLKDRLIFLFNNLNIANTKELVLNKIKPVKIHKDLESFYPKAKIVNTISTEGLSD